LTVYAVGMMDLDESIGDVSSEVVHCRLD